MSAQRLTSRSATPGGFAARILVASVVAAGLGSGGLGCAPDFAPGTYFCGPERLCPPALLCHEPTYTCESPLDAEPFRCPEGSEAAEPDDELATARELTASCGGAVLALESGCLVSDSTVDLYALTVPTDCAGSAPHLELRLRFPVAFRPLLVELLDDAGAVVATSELCTPELESSGTEWQCLTYVPTAARLFIRVAADPSGPDCDGGCRHNQYWLSVTHQLS